jgi:hypothetical protein
MEDAEYQLVVQFDVADDDEHAIGSVLDLEEEMIETMDPRLGLVDGHDVGSGEMNLFILTDDPNAAFAFVKPLLERVSLLSRSRVAYRDIDRDDFTVLWPLGLTSFDVK